MLPKKTGGNSEQPEKKQKLGKDFSDDGAMKMLLGLPPEAPPRPPWPTAAQIADGTAMPVEKLAALLHRSVVYKLSLWCYKNSSISLRKPLDQLECPQFSSQENGITDSSDSGNPQNAASGARVTTFKEPWDMENCKKSLIENGIYEAATPIWKTDPIGENPPTHHSHHHLGLLLSSVWSEESYAYSFGRFIVPGSILTHADSIQDVESIVAKKTTSFKDLPIDCGHLLVWSLLRAFDIAFADGKEERILRLFEASLSVTLRMRLAPSNEQKILDKLRFSETVRLQRAFSLGTPGVESFFVFATFVGSLEVIVDDMSGSELQETCKTLGITYSGLPVERTLADAILAILPYTKSTAACSAVKSLETVSPWILSDPFKVLRACIIMKKTVLADDLIDAFVYWVEELQVDLLRSEMNILSPLTTSFGLVGTNNKIYSVGHLQVTMQKRSFAKWFLQEQLQLATTSDNFIARGLTEIMQKTSTPLTFYRHFSVSFLTVNSGWYYSEGWRRLECRGSCA
jgi:hypothetical protein